VGVRRLLPLTACALALMLLFAGCDGPSRLDLPETDEPLYKRGQQFLRSQQNQLALESFLKLIDRRDGDAPESHFEAGRVYLTHLKDPYAAIYHFRRYLQLKPNNPQAPMVNQMIETAMKESLKGLPGTAMSAEVDRLDLLDMVQKLKGENAELRAQLDRAGIAVNTPATLAPTQNPNPGATRPAQTPPTTVAQQTRPAQPPRQQVQQAETLPVEELPVQPPVLIETLPPQTQTPATVRQPPQRPGGTTAPVASASGRTYTVQPKDNLTAISRKIYGTPTRWREIYELNRDRMKSETDLKIGMQLRLP
jgi:tetratricopeptide (TPR) repeat protein